MSTINPKSGKAKLKPRARLISLIGEQLISDEPVALVELVKNSYDADATFVEVKFEGRTPDKPDRIVVTDDGTGMDLNTVLNVWLEPGTANKRQKNKSTKGRLLQGAKGIGRFAAARLGKSLFLQTKSDDSDKEVIVTLNWGKFNEDNYIEDIDVDYETSDSQESSGTRLIIEELRTSWSEGDYLGLYDRLSRLISPFDEVKDFEIKLDIPGYSEFSRTVEAPDIIQNPRYMLRGELDEDGYFSGEFLFENVSRKVWGHDWAIKHSNFNESHVEQKIRLGKKGQQPNCGGFEFEIRAWDRDKEGLEPYALQYASNITKIRGLLNRYSGVSIYRDGFRVYPYGQRGNDWLELDNRSRQSPTMRLANNQIIAAVKISRERNAGLEDRSNREGLVVNEAYIALKSWFEEILSILEIERYAIRPRNKVIQQSSNSLFESFDLSNTVALAKETLGDEHEFVSVLINVAHEVDKGVEHVQEMFSQLLTTAGLGQMIDMIIHDIGQPIGKLDRNLLFLRKEMQKNCESGLPYIEAMKAAIEQLHIFHDRLDPHTPAKRGRSEFFHLGNEIQNNFDLFEFLLERQKITYEIRSSDSNVRIKMVRSNLGQILANLIDNSLYWLTKVNGLGQGGKIQVDIQETESEVKIIFSDDGPGVTLEDRLRIFDPYFSRKPHGGGLGLHIARLLIESHGRIIYGEECDLSGACFEIILNKEQKS